MESAFRRRVALFFNISFIVALLLFVGPESFFRRLSRGGSGDLLAGLIGSFAAQGYPPETAAAIGVSVQGLGCELASERLSRRGMLPSDIISVLPLLFQKIERHGLIEKNCYDPGGADDSGDRLHGEADVDG